jgi:hypothetical protein
MALTKEQVIDKIEVVENGYLLVRQVTRILEDGNELSKSYHRSSFAPGSDVTGQPSNVQAIAAAAWTPAVIAAYEAQQAAQHVVQNGQ